MKKILATGVAVLVLAAAAVVVVAVAAVAVTWPAEAQSRPDVLTLEGLGSTIGVSVRDLTAEEASPSAVQSGVMIDDVREGTPAASAGFRRGDIVVEFDGERVRSARHFARIVRETRAGREVRATIVRGGAREVLNVTPRARGAADLVDLPEIRREIERGWRGLPPEFDFDFDFDLPGDRIDNLFRGGLGATLTPLNPQLAEYFGVKDGLLVASVQPESRAARAGLKAGDIITAVGGTAVRTPSDVSRAVRGAQPGTTTELRVTREKKELTLTVPAAEPRAPRTPRRGRPV